MNDESRHAIMLTLGTGITALLSMTYSIVVGRSLGPSHYADFVAALSLIYLCNIALGPINGTIAKFTAQYAGASELGKVKTLSHEFLRWLSRHGVVGLIVGLGLLWPLKVALQFGSYLAPLASLLIIYSTLLLSVYRGVLRGLQRFGQLSLNIVTEAGIRLVIGLVLVLTFGTVFAGLSAYIVGLVAVLMLSQVQLRDIREEHEPQGMDAKEVKNFVLPMFLLMAAAAGFQNIDMLVVKSCFAATEAGHYGAATTLARSMTVLATPFATILLPLLANLHEKRDQASGVLLRNCLRFLLLAALPLILFWLWPERIVVLLYGEDYRSASSLLFLLSLSKLVELLCYILVLAGAAVNDFRMLWLYLPGLFGEVVLLAVWNDSLLVVIYVLLITQIVLLATILSVKVGRLRRPPLTGAD